MTASDEFSSLDLTVNW